MYGAEIVYSPGAQGSNGAVNMALEMAGADASYYMPYQYGNPANPDAHYHGTAIEILEELDEVAAFVGGLGTGGTLMGNARRLKEENPDTLIVAAEPLQGELVQGLRSLEDGYIPPIIDLSLLDRKIFVSNRDSVVWTKRLLARGGPVRGCLQRRGRGHRRARGQGARRGQRGLRRTRRRLEVPQLGRLHTSRSRSSKRPSIPRRSGRRLSSASGPARRRPSRARRRSSRPPRRLPSAPRDRPAPRRPDPRRPRPAPRRSRGRPGRPTASPGTRGDPVPKRARGVGKAASVPRKMSATTRITMSSSGPGAERNHATQASARPARSQP